MRQDLQGSFVVAHILTKLDRCGANNVRRISDVLSDYIDVEHVVHASETRRKSQSISHWTNALKHLKRSHKFGS